MTLFLVATGFAAQAQLLPTFQFGLKGALNYSQLRTADGGWLNSDHKAGYQAGLWARIGGAGVHLQPELYITGKNTQITVNPNDINAAVTTAEASFTSVDVPVLLGTSVGLAGVNLRFQAGPLFSFLIDKNLGSALGNAMNISEYRNALVAATGGVGLDIGKLRADVRYEHGITNMSTQDGQSQRVSLFSVGVGYRLF